jgi:hypothetical protein
MFVLKNKSNGSSINSQTIKSGFTILGFFAVLRVAFVVGSKLNYIKN